MNRRIESRRLSSHHMARRVAVAAIVLCGAASPTRAQAAGKGAKKAIAPAAASAPAASGAPNGQKVFSTTCQACHQVTGEGLGEQYPPLAGSEWVAEDDAKVVRIILHGLTGPIEVAGQTFSGAMPPWGGILSDQDIAAVATYVRGAWGNKAAPITTARVKKVRAATLARKTPWTAAELAAVKPGS